MMDSEQPISQARAEKAVVADFDQAFGQDVLEETVDELFGREGASLELAGIGKAVAESDLAMCQLEDAIVADGDTEDVWGQVFQSAQPIAHGLTVNDPFLQPHLVWYIGKAVGVAQGITKLGAKDPGEGLHRKEKVLAGRQPGLAVRR